MIENEATRLAANPQVSCTVRAIAYCGDVGYCVAVGVAMFFLVVAGAFSALTPEPLWLRAMSFAVLGLVPTIAACLLACLISWSLRRAGRIYDPVATVLGPAVWAIMKHTLSALLDMTQLGLIYFASAREACAKFLRMYVRVIVISAQVFHRLQRIALFHVVVLMRMYWRCGISAVRRMLRTCKEFASQEAARLCSALHHYSGVAARRIMMSVTFPIRLVARVLLKLIAWAA